MDILIGVLLLVATVGAFWGVVQLFRKGRRKRGLTYIAGAFGIVIVAGLVVGWKNERDARAAGFASYEEQQAAEEAEEQRLIAELVAQRERELLEERDRLEALAREQGYESYAAMQAAERVAERAAERADSEDLTQERAERAAVARDTQEAAEAAEPTEEEERQARLASKTARMTEQVSALVRDYYGIEVEPLIPDRPLCREDGYCNFYVSVFYVEVYGAGLAVVEPTNQVSMSDYVEMCGVVLAAISGSEANYAGEVVGLIYGAAMASGSAERDFSGVKIEFAPSLGGDLECRLFKY